MGAMLTFLPAFFRFFGMFRGFIGVVQPFFPHLAKWFMGFGSRMAKPAR
jgi:hypothetical protein